MPRSLLARSIEDVATAMARTDPTRWTRLVRALDGHAMHLMVDSESVTVRLEGDRLKARAGRRGRIDAAGAIDRRTLVELVEGQCSPVEALFSGRLEARADPATLLAIADALTAFIEAAVRYQPMQVVWLRYRAESSQVSDTISE